MHELRNSILSGDGGRPNGLVAAKKAREAPSDGASLLAIRVKKQEARASNERREDRHRDLVEEATLHHRRKKRQVRVVNISASGLLIETDTELGIGEAVQVQLDHCDKAPCHVRWIRGGRIGLEFEAATTITGSKSVRDYVISRLRGDVPSGGPGGVNPERAIRHSLIWFGHIHFDHDSWPVRVRNISPTGAMLESRKQFEPGSSILLDLDAGGTVFATVKWCKGGQIGVKFDGQFDLKRLLAANAAPVSMPSYKKPDYLKSEGKADSPWYNCWDKLSVDELQSTLSKASG